MSNYTALHPNIAVKLYKGKESYITHQNVAEKACIDVKAVKQEHLAFFNKTLKGMRKSPLYKHYSKHEPAMLERIRKDKKQHGYKVTSRRLFEAEVGIMTDVIANLNAQGIEVLYVYDALVCEEKDKAVVTETMNRVILKHGIKTAVKVDTVAARPLLTKEQIKNHLRSLLSKEKYRSQFGTIEIMLTTYDIAKTDEEYNAYYQYILESLDL